MLAERNERGFWEGELSGSALSTATAVTALALGLEHNAFAKLETQNPKPKIERGLRWLAGHQNADGGWGDTTKSLSNISTTTLGWAAFGAARADVTYSAAVHGAERWLTEKAGGISPDQLAGAIIARYGKDRTFSVPILTMCALAGRLGEGREAWRHVIPLPFELAACPHQLFAALRLPVVSYALPALIAIGQARHVHAPSRNPFAWFVRRATREKTLGNLKEIMPANGGFLEATPLTSFVTMSLAASGQANHLVTQRGLEFLLQSQRADGNWPIDTNLSTWCTTLAIDALPQAPSLKPQAPINWLLQQQYPTEHPYTHAAPGGWAWTDLPGGVPDADDTAGALLALAKLRPSMSQSQIADSQRAAEMGVRWLLNLQNRDGGIPTFCRGWGALPFDRSSADITAHAARAWLAWFDDVPPALQQRLVQAWNRALRFLCGAQKEDGSWLPLWFGNQHEPEDINPVYGTSRVLCALGEAAAFFARHEARKPFIEGMHLALERQWRGMQWLVRAQQPNGGWSGGGGGAVSVEETALAVGALAGLLHPNAVQLGEPGLVEQSVARGVSWLIERVESGAFDQPSPIGFYFAKLWYFERLYPMIFTVGALRAAVDVLDAK